MRPIGLALLLLIACIAGRVWSFSPQQDDTVWTDARELRVEGMGWPDESTSWTRLPDRAEELVRGPVWGLSRHSAGIAIRFVTDSTEVSAEWTLTSDRLAMPHMPATGVSGLDLYLRTDEGWRWAHACRPVAETNTEVMLRGLDGTTHEFMLFLPLYNGVESVRIGIRPDSRIEPGPERQKERARPIVYYGTSIAQGACASRTGSCHVAILGRRLDRPMINLGFSGNGRLEPEIADLLGELEAAVYVIDCLPNLDGAKTAERAVPFVRRLRALRPDTPILLVEDRTYADAWLDEGRSRRNRENRQALREAHATLLAAGIGNISYLEGETLLGDGNETTVDGSHPNDLGFKRQADAIEPVLRAILEPVDPTPSG